MEKKEIEGQVVYSGVEEDCKMSDLEFTESPNSTDDSRQQVLHTNLGTLTVLDRMTGFSGGIRDTETGFRCPKNGFWGHSA